ncbi:MAG: hypothetical protein H9W81_08400 [Enterococcus sp.]|nr:hypothetical protein [Enterococcus sp.]
MSEILMPKVLDPETKTFRRVRLIQNPKTLKDLVEPMWPDGHYFSYEEYYLTRFQTSRDSSAEFNVSIESKIAETETDEGYDAMLYAFDDLLNRFIYFWRIFEHMATNPDESITLTPQDISRYTSISQAMVTMYQELHKLQEANDSLLLGVIRYLLRISVRSSEREHPIRKMRHPRIETHVSHVLATQSLDLFLLRMGIDILRVPFKDLVEVGETDFEKKQFTAIISNFND